MQRLHVADHANNFAPLRQTPDVRGAQRWLLAAHLEPLAKRIFIRKIAPGQGLVDEHGAGRLQRVGLAEVASAQHPPAQRAQPVGRDALEFRFRLFLRLERRPAKNREGLVRGAVLTAQQAAARAHGLHAGQSAETFDQFPQ